MKIQKILLLVVLMVLLSNIASAYVDATFSFNKNDVKALAYNCEDISCSKVSPFSGKFDGATSTNNGKITIIFPSKLKSKFGYALFFYSPGSIPIAGKTDFNSNKNKKHFKVKYDVNFEQVKDCQSIIDEFSITNDAHVNEPLIINTIASLNAKTASAFSETDNGVKYIPPEMIKKYYSADIKVDLEIKKNGSVVNTQTTYFDETHNNPIKMDEQANVNFKWIPKEDGKHTAVVRTIVTDPQCYNSLRANSEKNFNVLPKRPTNECYTLLNNLKVDNHYPNVGEELTFTVDKISNYANENHVLEPVPTKLGYFIYENHTLIDSKVIELKSNNNAIQAETYSFKWTPKQSGNFKVIVKSNGDSNICDSIDNPYEIISLEFNVKEKPKYNLDLQVVDANNGSFIENVSISIPGHPTQYTNKKGRTVFRNLNGFTNYTYIAKHSQYVTTSNTVTIKNVSMAQKFTMVPAHKTDLNVTINCFKEVIENHEQSCSAFVTYEGQPVKNAIVNFKYKNGNRFSTCVTDDITGGCTSLNLVKKIGHYDIRAVATAKNHKKGTSDWFGYDVMKERYDIVNLKIYNNSAFTQEDYTFYRGENMYVSFKTIDTENNNVLVPDLVSKVTLVSTPGGRANLSLIRQSKGYYYYKLTPIPPTHEFLGRSQAFAFVFNYTDKSGGEEIVSLTILNNKPTIQNEIPDQYIRVGETVELNLSQYAYDLEDKYNNLSWRIDGVNQTIEKINLDNNYLEITGLKQGIDKVTFNLIDKDNAITSQDVNIYVTNLQDFNVDIECFKNVINNHEQSCSVFVNNNNQPIGNQFVDIRYNDGTLFGTCETDSISGGCEVTKIEREIGSYSVRAEVSREHFNTGYSEWFNYSVLKERYDIINLKVYNDSAFTQEDYTFYRGENMYVSFESTDILKNNVPVPNLVSKVILVSTPGGRAELSLVKEGKGYYYYKLTPIPATHSFLGNSQAFAFVFNYTDKSGGEEVVDLTILNNPPIFTKMIPDQYVNINETISIDLSQYAYDLEDHNLRWSASGTDDDIAYVHINDNFMTIMGIHEGNTPTTIHVRDDDNDYASQSFNIIVNNPTNDNHIMIDCRDFVEVGNLQTCHVYVDNQGQPVSEQSVILRTENSIFGTCTTDDTGFCEVSRRENNLGRFQVRGIIQDNNQYVYSEWFNYEVIRERYIVSNLQVYRDNTYTTQSNTFYRGDAMYIGLNLYDTMNNIDTSYLVTNVNLITQSGARVRFYQDSRNLEGNHFILPRIPLEDDFLGNMTYYFEISLRDNTIKNIPYRLNLLNNEPFISKELPEVYVRPNNSISFDLRSYVLDLEDHQNINWRILSQTGSDKSRVEVNRLNNLNILGLNQGLNDVKLIAMDSDGGYLITHLLVHTTRQNECSDGTDNDGDGLVDDKDPGCHWDGNVLNDQSYDPLDDDESDSHTSTIRFTNTPPKHAWVLSTYRFDLDAINSINLPIKFYLVQGPSTFSIDEDTGVINWLVLPSDLGTRGIQNITVVATDGVSSAYLTWEVKVESKRNMLGKEKVLRNELGIMKIRFPNSNIVEKGDQLRIALTMENNGDFDLDQIKSSVMSYDFGMKRSIGPFDLDKGDSISKILTIDIPKYTKPGEYDLRIVTKNNDVTRIKHRTIRVI